MKKYAQIIIVLLSLIGLTNPSQAQTIDFIHGKAWKDVVAQAKNEKKLIFIDVYTEWCGPCRMMEDNVFINPTIWSFYNASFVNFKLDAEKGEGIELRQKFEVKSYPTYLFIDPETQQIVHRSSSRQDPDVFLWTGKSALNPNTQSVFLEKQYQSGVRTPELIENYTAYLKSCYKTEELNEVINEYFSSPNTDPTTLLSWTLAEKYVHQLDNKVAQALITNRAKLTSLYGKEKVEGKLTKLYSGALSSVIMSGIYNKDRFNENEYNALYEKAKQENLAGSDFMLKKADVLNLLRKQEYKQAALIADELPSMAEVPSSEIIDFYRTLVFLSSRTIDTPEWIKYAITYAQYIAYNAEERRNVEDHYDYAVMLEKVIRNAASAKDIAPASIIEGPKYGKKEYSLRSSKLKPKPRK